MDPEATLRVIINAACEGDAEQLRESANDLANWIEAGGFAPGRPSEPMRRVERSAMFHDPY